LTNFNREAARARTTQKRRMSSISRSPPRSLLEQLIREESDRLDKEFQRVGVAAYRPSAPRARPSTGSLNRVLKHAITSNRVKEENQMWSQRRLEEEEEEEKRKRSSSNDNRHSRRDYDQRDRRWRHNDERDRDRRDYHSSPRRRTGSDDVNDDKDNGKRVEHESSPRSTRSSEVLANEEVPSAAAAVAAAVTSREAPTNPNERRKITEQTGEEIARRSVLIRSAVGPARPVLVKRGRGSVGTQLLDKVFADEQWRQNEEAKSATADAATMRSQPSKKRKKKYSSSSSSSPSSSDSDKKRKKKSKKKSKKSKKSS
jgi:hypothetical protein